MNTFASYYDSAFASSADTGSIYGAMTKLIAAAHERRMALLDSLPIGSLKGKTVVDFGTGSWGFACIFPRLHDCKLAIGIDISAEAVKVSKKVSASGNYLYGNRFKYYVADGLKIPLESQSVDLFFTGECIEHVENTDAFLDEIYRVLKPGGVLILTTPNPEPLLYRQLGDRYAVGPEHIALLTYQELSECISVRFNIELFLGYNTSFHTQLDSADLGDELCTRWVSAHEHEPELATGFILMASKKPGYLPYCYKRTTYMHTSNKTHTQGEWLTMNLHDELDGAMGKHGSSLSLDFSGNQLIALFWAHDWSGIAEVCVDDEFREVDLFEHTSGFRRVVFTGLDSARPHTFRVKPTGRKNPRSLDDQIIFFSASAYTQTRS